MYIELHIDELVLHGFAHGDRYLISEALQRELTRLFVDGDTTRLLAQGGDFSRMDAGVIDLAPDAKPAMIGAQVAQAVYGGLNQ